MLAETPQLRDFQLIKTLGTGTFGRVYLTLHAPNGLFYAMKVLKKLEIVRLKQVEHIRSEVEILRAVQHPFIVNLHKSYQDVECVYMLEEYPPFNTGITRLMQVCSRW